MENNFIEKQEFEPKKFGKKTDEKKVEIKKQEPKRHYEKRLWNGKIPVYVCLTCGEQSNSEDDMKIHVTNHVTEDKKNDLLDSLI